MSCRINGLEPFGKCSQLQELYLRKNEVHSLDELKHLKSLESLRVLWLCDNPCADTPDYRPRSVSERNNCLICFALFAYCLTNTNTLYSVPTG
jgi:Leucine-rich repeat (LRR) protein